MCVCMHAKSLQLGLTLCNPMDCSPPSSSVYGILQARILEWVVMFFCFLTQGLNPHLPSLTWVGRFFTTSPTWEAYLSVQVRQFAPL